jgi:hypothetical protein
MPCAVFIVEPNQDRHLMTDVAALPASHRRFPSPPTARRSAKALRSQAPHLLSKPRVHANPAHARPRKRSSSSFPPRKTRAAGLRSATTAPSPTPKPP